MPVALSRRALLALLVSPLLAAACGAPNPTPTASPAATAATAPATTAPAPAGTPNPAATPLPTTPPPTAAATRPPATGFAGQLDPANPRPGGRLVEGWVNEVRTLNPVFVTDVISAHVANLLYNGLVKINPDSLLPEPDLALTWRATPDGKSYTFQLRPGVAFHDGTPCTAEDVKFTYDLLLNERASPPRLTELTAVLESVAVVSPTEVQFTLKAPFAPFAALYATHGIVPKHLLGGLEPAKIEQSEFSLLKPVGTGPFRFKEWLRGASLTLTRYEGYYAGRPPLEEVVLKVAPSQDALQMMLRVDEIDVGLVREGDVDELARQQNLLLSRVDSLSISYLAFQLDPDRSTLFQDKRVRQALAFALDRETLVRQGRHGVGRVAGGSVPPPSWAAGDRLVSRLPFDLARAEQLLDGAGWRKEADGLRARDGKKLALELLTNRGSGGNRVREQYAQLIQDQWRKVGVETKLTLVDFQEVVNRLRKTHEFDVCLATYACDVDPDQRVLWTTDAYRTGFNASRYSNPALDRLLTEAVTVQEQAQRRDRYVRAQETLLDDLPSIIVDYPLTPYAVNRRLRNVIPNPVGLGYNAHQWWASDGQ